MVRYEAVDEDNMLFVQETNLPEKKYKIELNYTKSLAEVKVSFMLCIAYSTCSRCLMIRIAIYPTSDC